MTLPYLGIEHLGVAVRDAATARSTFCDQLGFAAVGEERLDDRGLVVTMLACGESRMELLAPTGEDSEISAFLARRGEGLHHVAVRVADLTQALAELRQRGARLIDQTPQRGAHGTRVAFVHPKGAHGVLLELVECAEEPVGDPHE